MKNISAFVFCLLFHLHIIHAQGTGYVELEGKQFKNHNVGAPYYPILNNWRVSIQTDGTNYYPSPTHTYGPTHGFECSTTTSCRQQILNQFNYMRSLGFNGIRLNGLFPYYNTSSFQFEFDTYDLNVTKQSLDVSIPSNADIIFNAYYEILEIAKDVTPQPFYVIINTGGQVNTNDNGDILFPWSAVQSHYVSFLSGLSARLFNHSHLLAYDLYNEPCLAIKKDPLFNKKESCVLVQEWVDAIHANDQNHLTTIGNCWDESIKFDPACLKIDFNSPHFYPLPSFYGQTVQTTLTKYQQQVDGILYWLGKNMPIPWIVGETGFRAIDADPFDPVPPTWQNELNGTEANQLLFAQTVVPRTRDCEASGFSWWNFQDGFDMDFTNPKRGSNFFGVLYRGITSCPDPLNPCAAMNKPVSSFFSNYGNNPLPPVNSSNCTPPLNNLGFPDPYFDPYNHNNMNSNGDGEVTGTVTDQDGNPVGDALVYGWSWLNTTTNSSGKKEYTRSPCYTFTRSNLTATPINLIGSFKIRPYNYFIPDHRLTNIWFTGIGLELKEFGTWEDNQLSQINYSPSLKRIHFGYEGIANNLTISTTQHNLRGGEELTVTNATINNFSTTEISARKKVFLSEFRAELGSYVHIFNSSYDHCISYDGLRIIQPFASETSSESNPADGREIHLNFKSEISCILSPNPSNAEVTIEMNGFDKSKEIIVADINGKTILIKHTIASIFKMDLSTLHQGLYFITINDHHNTLSKKLIIIH